MRKCALTNLDALLRTMAEAATVYLPVDGSDGRAHFTKWEDGVKMSEALNTVRSAKDFFFPQTENLVDFKMEGKTIEVIDIREGSEKEIYLTKSPFGFNFATKVVSLMDMTGGKADESNPFGNMLPFMLMGENKDFDPMMLMLMNGGKMDMSNPMMMYFLMKDTNHKDMLPLLMMMNAKG